MMIRREHVYNWVAETARLIPDATFGTPRSSYRDGRSRVRVTVNGVDQLFVISEHKDHVPAQPQEVLEHFTRLGEE